MVHCVKTEHIIYLKKKKKTSRFSQNNQTFNKRGLLLLSLFVELADGVFCFVFNLSLASSAVFKLSQEVYGNLFY